MIDSGNIFLNYKGEDIDWSRFQLRARDVLFKSRIAIAKESKQYNKWYVIAHIPTDLNARQVYRGVVRSFVDRGYKTLTEDEVRAAALAYLVAA